MLPGKDSNSLCPSSKDGVLPLHYPETKSMVEDEDSQVGPVIHLRVALEVVSPTKGRPDTTRTCMNPVSKTGAYPLSYRPEK